MTVKTGIVEACPNDSYKVAGRNVKVHENLDRKKKRREERGCVEYIGRDSSGGQGKTNGWNVTQQQMDQNPK